MIDADAIRPNGIKRKLLMSPEFTISSAGDFIIGYFPHGAVIRGIWAITTVAITTADNVIDIGIAKDGDTVIDGKTLAYSASAIGDVTDVFQTKGSNGGLTEVAVGGTLWLQTDGGGDAGAIRIVVEYEDRNN